MANPLEQLLLGAQGFERRTGLPADIDQYLDRTNRSLAPQSSIRPEQRPMAGPAPQMAPAPAQQRRGLLGGFFAPEGRDARQRLAIALEGLALNPNQALIGQLQSDIESRKSDRQKNATVAWLRSRGRDDLAQALETGSIEAATAVNEALRSADPMVAINREKAQIELDRLKSGADLDPNVQSSASLPDQSGVVLTMRDGSVQVRTVGGQILSGKEAMDFVRTAQENAAEYQRSIYGARREGTLSADISMGGEAARVAKEGELAPQIAEEYNKRAETVQSSLSNLDSAIRAIDEGAKSGIVYDMLPNVSVASAELQNARQRLGLDVIGSVTFGALSEGELRLAMDTAVPAGLPEPELRIWLERKREAQAKALIAMQEAAMHFAQGGTREGYLRKIGVGGGQPAAGGGSSNLGLSPEDMQYLEGK